MKCIILCAGYATRLYPLTKNFPKPLLKVGNKAILDHIIDKVNKINEVDKIYVVSNDKYYNQFLEHYKLKSNIEVVNDMTVSNEDRLGPTGDVIYTISNKEIDDDLLIIAGDSLFTYELDKMYEYFKQVKITVISGREETDVDLLRRLGVVTLDSNNKVTGFIEKPKEPISNIGTYLTYMIAKKDIKYYYQFKEEGYLDKADCNLIEYLYKKSDVYTYKFKGEYYDVGTHETLNLVNKMYSK